MTKQTTIVVIGSLRVKVNQQRSSRGPYFADALTFFIKAAYVVGIHLNCLKAIQMSTHNRCFYKAATR